MDSQVQRIDFVIPNNDTSIDTPFKNGRKLIIGEFKSENDKLLDGDLLMLLSKSLNYIATTHGYGNKKSDLDPIDISQVSCILFLGGNKSVSSFVNLNFNIVKIENGLFEVVDHFLHILIIEIDNIALSKEFEALRIFATEKIREKTLKEAILSDNIFINSVAYFLYREELRALAEAEGKPLSAESVSIISAVESIGLARVIEEVGLSKVIEEVGLDKLFKHLSDDQLDELMEMRKTR